MHEGGSDRGGDLTGSRIGSSPTASLILSIILATGCSDGPSATAAGLVGASIEPPLAGRGPRVNAVDSLRLEETEFHLGRPLGLSVDTTDGSFLIADSYSAKVFRFARDGRLVQWYGRSGEGPGEFTGLDKVLGLNDTIVVGTDSDRDLLTRFARDGEGLGSTRCDGCWGGVPTVAGDMAFIPAMDIAGRATLATWDWRRDVVRKILPQPGPYRRSLEGTQAFFGIFGGAALSAWTDTLLVGLVGMNELFLTAWDGEPLDTLYIPRVRRRGVPPDAQQRIDRRDESVSFRDRIEMLSTLYGVYRMSDRSTLLIHQDNSITGEPPLVEFVSDIHVSVLSPDRTAVCADGPLTFANQMQVVHTVARDTVFLLDRTLVGTGDAMQSWVRSYRIDTTQCDWLPVR